MAGDGWLCVVCVCVRVRVRLSCQFGAARVVAGSCVSCVVRRVLLCATSGVKVVEG
jgi:hypothetical protein